MIAPQVQLPLQIAPNEQAMIFDVAFIINAVYQQTIEPTQAGRVPKRIANKLRSRLKGIARFDYTGNDDYLDMICAVMDDLKLIQLVQPPFEGMKAHVAPSSFIPTWSAMDVIQQTQLLLKEWLSSHHWIDVVGFNYKHGETWNYTNAETRFLYFNLDYRLGRQTLLKQIKQCQPEQWYSIPELIKKIWQEAPLGLRHAYSTKMSSKEPVDFGTWVQIDGECYTGMIASTLFDLGIVLLGFDAEPSLGNNPSAFQLTSLGASVLAIEENQSLNTAFTADEKEQPPSLIVQPNFEILLLQLDLPTIYRLLPFTQINHLGMASSFKLTGEALLRGMRSQLTLKQILETLQELSARELPQNVVYTLQDWAKQYKEARLSQVLLIEVPTETIAQQLCTNEKLLQYGIRQITPCQLAVSADADLNDLKKIIEKCNINIHFTGNVQTTRENNSYNQLIAKRPDYR
ncbi:helicase-associated domain-containing protein [Tengunoibacter tsumagoiensis]|nr:helicase-associated domain-containing protein [Tengunoibacter tsumagoiensis]